MAAAAHDEWVDAQKMRRRHPDTFEGPTAEEILAIQPGHYAKLCNGEERFWVQVTTVGAGGAADRVFQGTVANSLFILRGYDFGDTVEFRGRHVYACMGPQG